MMFPDSNLVERFTSMARGLGYPSLYVSKYHMDPPLPHSHSLVWRGDNLRMILQQQEPDKQRFVDCLKTLFGNVPFEFKYIKEDFAVVNDWGETLAEGSECELVINLSEIVETIKGPI